MNDTPPDPNQTNTGAGMQTSSGPQPVMSTVNNPNGINGAGSTNNVNNTTTVANGASTKWPWIVALVVIVLLIVGLVGLLVWQPWKQVSEDDGKLSGTGSSTVDKDTAGSAGTGTVSKMTPEEEVKAILARIQDEVVTSEMTVEETDYPVDYKFDGVKVFTSLDKGMGLSITARGATSDYVMSGEFAEVLIGELINVGFSSYYNDAEGLSSGMASYFNSDTGVVCNLSYSSLPTSVACGHISWISEEKKSLINELAEAMEAKNSSSLDELSVISVKDINIEDSQYSPYQRTSAGLSFHNGIGGAGVLFYRTSPEAKWQYFTATQGGIECVEYDTEDLQKAYAGESCWDMEKVDWDTVKVK